MKENAEYCALILNFVRRYIIMSELKGACVIGQSGGPTSVINSSVLGALETALDNPSITRVFGMAHGIKGLLNDDLYGRPRGAGAPALHPVLCPRLLPLQAGRSRCGRHRLQAHS